MLAYLSNRPAVAARTSNPHLMLAVIAAHVAGVAVVMSIKMDLPQKLFDSPTKVTFVDELRPAEPVERHREPTPAQPQQPSVVVPDTLVPPVADPPPLAVDPMPEVALPASTEVAANTFGTGALATPTPIAATVAVLLTSAAELKPPYPASRLDRGEEATLKLRITVGPNGKVTNVEPVGRADPAFLAAARAHIMAHWRYRPASRDGEAVSSTMVINLRFQLDD